MSKETVAGRDKAADTLVVRVVAGIFIGVLTATAAGVAQADQVLHEVRRHTLSEKGAGGGAIGSSRIGGGGGQGTAAPTAYGASCPQFHS